MKTVTSTLQVRMTSESSTGVGRPWEFPSVTAPDSEAEGAYQGPEGWAQTLGSKVTSGKLLTLLKLQLPHLQNGDNGSAPFLRGLKIK